MKPFSRNVTQTQILWHTSAGKSTRTFVEMSEWSEAAAPSGTNARVVSATPPCLRSTTPWSASAMVMGATQQICTKSLHLLSYQLPYSPTWYTRDIYWLTSRSQDSPHSAAHAQNCLKKQHLDMTPQQEINKSSYSGYTNSFGDTILIVGDRLLIDRLW